MLGAHATPLYLKLTDGGDAISTGGDAISTGGDAISTGGGSLSDGLHDPANAHAGYGHVELLGALP